MKRVGRRVVLVAALALAPLVATAGATGAKVGGVVEESAKAGGTRSVMGSWRLRFTDRRWSWGWNWNRRNRRSC